MMFDGIELQQNDIFFMYVCVCVICLYFMLIFLRKLNDSEKQENYRMIVFSYMYVYMIKVKCCCGIFFFCRFAATRQIREKKKRC